MRLELSADELLSTTRSVRKRLDLERPVPIELLRECIELAVQAPTGSNAQGWHWVVVTDAAKKAAIGDLYRTAFAAYRDSGMAEAVVGEVSGERARTQDRVLSSAEYLAEHMGEVPAMVIPCLSMRLDGLPSFATASLWGSLFPAAWSFMLAARERALGTCWTTLHLQHEQEVAELLGIPFDRVSQGLLIPVAYTVGTEFKPAPRVDLDDIVHVDSW
ncbi:MAG: nitroreductase family protein [Acidimicrobiia bacterium]|nr:nitroreductase family protein [Acidimicrobiia bacterium]